ncbi:hypothetical protein HNY73_017355 [Argiope bruennichi]|uniref:Uncharacterized protein n=1 Tax=Argiope bruennichi TaxID=94029 RepID=A0A8T0EQP3_ARGBR|nr:hypothetical protein HNY73_017355 [Argiope bruennichi]
MNNETKRQRTLVMELRNMISDLFDKADATEAEEEDKQKRDRKSVDEYSPHNKKAQAENLRREGIDDVSLLPLHPCDEFDEGRRSCTSIRQIGTTLTFGVHVEGSKDIKKNYYIRWFRFFKVFKSESEVKEELTTDKKPWNINLGEDNTELRISPITETDYSHNYFVAFLVKNQVEPKKDKLANLHYLKFYIQPLAIDMGTLYHGEELFINVRSFIELPESSVLFEWRQSDLDKTNNFPRNARHVSSNMKKNTDGSTLIIKEFMDSADKILSCDVYSNKNVFIAKRDFLLRKIAEPGDSEKDLEKEVAHERKRRSLPENYEYASYSDKEEEESDDSYEPEDDIKVINVDSSLTKKNSRKSPPEKLNERSPIYNTQYLQYHRRYKIPSAPTYREPSPIVNFYTKQLPILTYNKQNVGRYPENLPGRLNERSPVYNTQDPQFLISMSSASTYDEQLPNVSAYNGNPNAPAYNGKSNVNMYGKTPLNPLTNGEQPDTAYNRKPNVKMYGKTLLNPLTNGEQPDTAYNGKSNVNMYGKTPLNPLTNGEQPDTAVLKSPFLNTLINQANSLARSPVTQKNVEFRTVDIESQGILTFDDMESRLISNCKLDSECGMHAFCYGAVSATAAVFEPMFCRCKSDYVGNGIFCWLF